MLRQYAVNMTKENPVTVHVPASNPTKNSIIIKYQAEKYIFFIDNANLHMLNLCVVLSLFAVNNHKMGDPYAVCVFASVLADAERKVHP